MIQGRERRKVLEIAVGDVLDVVEVADRVEHIIHDRTCVLFRKFVLCVVIAFRSNVYPVGA